MLHSFIDNWLQYSVDETTSLPSSEFIQVVRILVKQLHAFGNSFDSDHNQSMTSLRSLAQPMMNSHMYSFLRSIIQRWPLDSSFSVVLELWLSYIQPWRYTYNRPMGTDGPQITPIARKFERFISDNIVCYTQIFIQLLPRFERLDFTSLKNIAMLYRLIKVFGQSNLADLLRKYEHNLFTTKKSSPIKSANQSLNSSGHLVLNSSGAHSSISSILNHSADQNDWNLSHASQSSASRPTSPFHNRSELHEMIYVHMFGQEIYTKVFNLLRKAIISREETFVMIKTIESETQKRYKGIAGYARWIMNEKDESENNHQLNDLKKIPEVIDIIIQSMGNIFDVSLIQIFYVDFFYKRCFFFV